MKKLLIGLVAAGLLAGCGKDNTNKDVTQKKTKQEVSKKDSFDPAAFMEESKKHGMDWYLASVSKLTPDQAAKLEAYNKEQDAKHQQDLKSILDNAATKESVNNEGQNVIEYTMKNTLGYDVDWFQLGWKEGTSDNFSQTTDHIKAGQEFKLIVDPSSDKTLKDIDMTTLKLNSSN